MKELNYPFSEKSIRALRAGDAVSITGRIYTGRDKFHKFFADGGKLPVEFRDGALYHCGPVVVSEDVRRKTEDEFRRHLGYLLQFRDQLAARFPNDHVPSPVAFASVKMHVHLFRYFNGRPGAAELRRRLNMVRTLGEIEDAVRGVLPELI